MVSKIIIYTLILLLPAGTYLVVTSFLILVIRKISLVVIIVLPGLMFYPGSSAVILAYDITRRDTLDTCLARDSLLVDMDVGGRLRDVMLRSDLIFIREWTSKVSCWMQIRFIR